MPTQAFGLYPAEGTAGDQVSSTYEGRHVTVTAAELLTSDGSGVATKGLPCIFGIVAGNHGVGVCLKTGTTTDKIAIDTEGIWDLSVVANDDDGASLVTGGDPLYINTSTGIISKIRSNASQIPFGYALGQVTAAATAVIAVKVHWDPRSHWLEDQEMLYFGNARDVSIEFDGTNLEMLPLVNDTGAFNIGNGTLSMDVQIFGNAAGSYMLWDSSLNTLDILSAIAVADNAITLTVTGSPTSGVLAAMFTSLETSGDGTSHAIVHNMLMTIAGDTTYAYVQYVGSATISDKTITQACGIFMYLEDMGNAVEQQAAISINRNITNVGINLDCFVQMRNHGGTDATAFMKLQGGATYLFDLEGPAAAPISDWASGTAVSHRLSVRIPDGTERWLHLHTS